MRVKEELWSGRVDSHDDPASFRFHQVVELTKLDEIANRESFFAFIGFESDEGVRRNKGRQGASKAPNHIREYLAKLPYHLNTSLIDVGNVACQGNALEEAQSALGDQVAKLLDKQGIPIILGGGHETLYGHYLGARQHMGPNQSLGIINIDAHFDMRDDPVPSSGTMFRQILEEDKEAGYLCLGIQRFGNTKALFDTAERLGCEYVFEEDLAQNNFETTFQIIDEFSQRYDSIILTLCTDSIIASSAPGVSAPSPTGIEPKTVKKLLHNISKKKNLLSFDLSEVNPTLDENEKTVRLASYLVAEVMAGMDSRKR